jgi:2-keto-4-pentenoate hydratase/2-oxohepta-3-ene-1,7-dioic acid hydratase in catechol pathway
MLIARVNFGDHVSYAQVIDDRVHLVRGDVLGEHELSGESFALDDVALTTPVPVGRLIAVMGGFLPPGEERPADAEPMWLPKVPNDPTGPGGLIPFPDVVKAEKLQAEAELAVVVGSTLRRASVDEARAGIFGWTPFNDVTAFEKSWGGMYFSVAKSLDGFAAFGPWVRTDLSEERVMEGLAITGKVNGVESQSGNTKYFKFTPSEMLSHISHHITLYPADIVTLGTPYPPGEFAAGDRVEVIVEEVGTLVNEVVSESEYLEARAALAGTRNAGH